MKATFPDVLTYELPPPPKRFKAGKPHPCADCGRRTEEHSGVMCLICRGPVEHHTRVSLAAEIVACARLTKARMRARRTTRPHEKWCVRNERKYR